MIFLKFMKLRELEPPNNHLYTYKDMSVCMYIRCLYLYIFFVSCYICKVGLRICI